MAEKAGDSNGFADVSVVMPAYRAAAVIGRALASIAAQTLKPREVVVVVDGSNDGTVEAARAMISRMNGIILRVFWQEHAGPGAARNRALLESSGRWIAFLDADDEWMPQKIERSMAHLDGSDLTLVAHDGMIVDGDHERENVCSRRFRAASDPFAELYRRGFIDTCSVVVRRQSVLDAGGFDPNLSVGQDFDLFLAILGRPGTRFTVFAEPLVRYHILPNSVTSKTFRRLFCQMRILRRHAPALYGRRGSRLAHIAFRTLAVHYEAMQAFRRRRHWLRMAAVLAILPFNLAIGAAAMFWPPKSQRHLVDGTQPPQLAPAFRLPINATLPWWIFVFGAYIAYLAQYADVARTALAAVGIR